MKKLLILLLLSSNALAADSCQYIWNLTGKGLNLGKSYDSLSLDSKMEINSIFEPSKFVATFGVKKVFRVVNFEDNKIVSRKEETFGKNNEDIIWNSKNNINWEKFEDSHKVDEIIIDSKNKIIDSTIFPYLALLNLLNLNQTNIDVIVLSKGSPYSATINIEEIKNDPNITHKISFLTEQKNGTVFTNSKKEPVEINFTDKNGTFNGKVIKNTCS